MTLRDKLIALFEAYCTATRRSPSRVATLICNSSTLLSRLREGGACSIDTWERAVAWFSVHWPADLDWPDGVDRPRVGSSEARKEAEPCMT